VGTRTKSERAGRSCRGDWLTVVILACFPPASA
jgi:hypothetical protein